MIKKKILLASVMCFVGFSAHADDFDSPIKPIYSRYVGGICHLKLANGSKPINGKCEISHIYGGSYDEGYYETWIVKKIPLTKNSCQSPQIDITKSYQRGTMTDDMYSADISLGCDDQWTVDAQAFVNDNVWLHDFGSDGVFSLSLEYDPHGMHLLTKKPDSLHWGTQN